MIGRLGRRLFATARPSNLPLELHYTPTPNGWKVTLLLEEAGLPYVVRPVDLAKGEQHTDAFRAISPNGRMPALVDPNCDGLAVFESGAIMMHIADTYPAARPFLPAEGAARSQTVQWLFWVNAGLGPMAGQLSHFTYYAPQLDAAADHTYAAARYRAEYHRLLGVLDRRLEATGAFLAGEAYTVADMAAYPWVKPWRRWMGKGLDEAGYPHAHRWYEHIKGRPPTARAIGVMRREAEAGQREREGKDGGLSDEGRANMFAGASAAAAAGRSKL